MPNNIHKSLPLFFIVFIIFLAACSNKRLGRNSIALEPIEVNASVTSLYRASAPIAWDIRHTIVHLDFNWKERTANGKAWLYMHPHFYATDKLTIDAKSMRIDSICILESGTCVPVKYKQETDSINIFLPKMYQRSEEMVLYFKYKAMPYAEPVGGSEAISEDRGLYFINTDYAITNKPAQIWTQGETESNSHWMPTIDKPNSRFTFEVALTVPDSFITLSNGVLKSRERSGTMRTDTWVIDKPIQAYAAMFAIGKFSIVKDDWKGREVSYYVEPEYASYARDMFKHTPEMMTFFSDITGVPYPWGKYGQIVVRDYVSGAMENTSASLFGEFMNQNSRENRDKDYEDIVAHELFHQWFGNYVTFESWSNLTLSESFANYSEQLWRKYKYGPDNAALLDYDDLQVYLGQAANNDAPLLRYFYSSRDDMFDRISYHKGGAILHYLHGLIGDSAFYKAMNTYLTGNALQSAEVSQWRMAVEKVTGQDWQWFFNQWYVHGGHPQLDIKYNYDDAAQILTVTVAQTQDSSAYLLPLKTAIIYGTERKTLDWQLAKRKETFSYPYQNGVAPLIVPDIEHWLIGTIKEDKQPRRWRMQYAAMTKPGDILNRRKAVLATRKELSDTATQSIYKLALQDKEENIRATALYMIQDNAKGKKWEDKWRADVVFTANNDVSIQVREAAFALLGTWKVKSAKKEMLEAAHDSSYAVAAAALNAIRAIDSDTVYALANELRNTQPRAKLQAAIWNIVAEHGRPEDFELFEKDANYVYGTQKISFAGAIAIYLQNVRSLPVFDMALDLYLKIVREEAISGYRAAMGGSFIETANILKQRIADAQTNTEKNDAQLEFDTMKKAADKFLAEERDENNKKQYRPYLKKIFGN